ncbi:Hypothetical_protein [Hexamita inflata]|uniref:Hypothetical_protein n=1 Tax=Hexamita inflata TaxID=28002 RepID=A0AA86R099_9EUKA|nr:Hypothetical protein HINF_LOCUS22459 [Hexamita inflata]CAI9957664.1 Hypothetical protein HINF_LOCUS45309 [Hexamita inflata]CAI9963717.1 Hypothetical protein HINF_LOCUS51362 [Hexamita inflata]CAI9964551.1 Hypothetical protein HINF_LOCUS52196 [Hexamita inflata]
MRRLNQVIVQQQLVHIQRPMCKQSLSAYQFVSIHHALKFSEIQVLNSDYIMCLYSTWRHDLLQVYIQDLQAQISPSKVILLHYISKTDFLFTQFLSASQIPQLILQQMINNQSVPLILSLANMLLNDPDSVLMPEFSTLFPILIFIKKQLSSDELRGAYANLTIQLFKYYNQAELIVHTHQVIKEMKNGTTMITNAIGKLIDTLEKTKSCNIMLIVEDLYTNYYNEIQEKSRISTILYNQLQNNYYISPETIFQYICSQNKLSYADFQILCMHANELEPRYAPELAFKILECLSKDKIDEKLEILNKLIEILPIESKESVLQQLSNKQVLTMLNQIEEDFPELKELCNVINNQIREFVIDEESAFALMDD